MAGKIIRKTSSRRKKKSQQIAKKPINKNREKTNSSKKSKAFKLLKNTNYLMIARKQIRPQRKKPEKKRVPPAKLTQAAIAKIKAELRKNHKRTNPAIAKRVKAYPSAVRIIRKELEDKKQIEAFDGRKAKRTGARASRLDKKIIKALLADPKRSNEKIAEEVRKALKINQKPMKAVRRLRLKLENERRIKKYRYEGLGENSRHPKTKEIEEYLIKNPKATHLKTGKKFGCSASVVAEAKKRLREEGKIPETESRGRKGQVIVKIQKYPALNYFLKNLASRISKLDKKELIEAWNESQIIEKELKDQLRAFREERYRQQKREIFRVYADLKQWQEEAFKRLPKKEKKGYDRAFDAFTIRLASEINSRQTKKELA